MLKYLYLPYQDTQLHKILFTNGEKARTWDAYQNARKGLLSDVFEPITSNDDHPAYLFQSGISSLAWRDSTNTNVTAAHSTYTLFLADQSVAASWLHSSLQGPAAQSSLGMIESQAPDGSKVSPSLRFEKKGRILLSIMGGLIPNIKEKL